MTDEQRAKRIHYHMYETCEGIAEHAERIVRLEEENEKLRKMVEAVLQCAGVVKRDKGCDACPMYDKSKAISIKSEWCRLRPTLRELGIEVNDG